MGKYPANNQQEQTLSHLKTIYSGIHALRKEILGAVGLKRIFFDLLIDTLLN